MFTRRDPNSCASALLSLSIAFAITLSLLAFPSSASRQSAPTKSEGLVSRTGHEPSSPEPEAVRARAQEAYGELDLSFEANHGQTDEQVRFLAHGAGYTLFLTATEAVFVMANSDCGLRIEDPTRAATEFDQPHVANDPHSATCNQPSKVLRMRVENANEAAHAEGLAQLPGIVNYFLGDDSAEWHANIPTFGRVRYGEIYQGIDLVYYGNQMQLEYDFVVQPGADASQVALAFEGADSLEVDDGTGDLLLKTGAQTLRQHKPFVYQEAGGTRREVESAYALKGGGRVGFRVGEYDRAKPLVIDPVLVYSTYLGGHANDVGNDIALDLAGNAYVIGTTFSTNFPTVVPFDGTLDGSSDAFVTKLNASGSAVVYSTYLGGNNSDPGLDIAVDTAGNSYLTGETASSDFPTVGAIDGTLDGTIDAFVVKLNTSGSELVYSTYLGGGGGETGNSIAVDPAGNAYLTGVTDSFNFPKAVPFDTLLSGTSDAFVTKLSAAGTALVYSTYLGGGSGDEGFGIAVDAAGNAYVTGNTRSTNFPTANAIYDTFGGGVFDAFVTKFNPDGSPLAYSTYLGGSESDEGFGITVDAAGNAYIVGRTTSTDFPTEAAIDNTSGGDTNAFVTKLNAAGSALTYSTLLGGDEDDRGFGIAVDSAGNAYVTGRTRSTDFPTVNAIDATYGGFNSDAFLTRLNVAGSAFTFSTYLGGGGTDESNGIAVDSFGNAYVTGFTSATDFPTTPGAFQEGKDSLVSAFVSKIGSYAIGGRVVDSSSNGISGVTITLSGSNAASAQTDAGGNFIFLDTTPHGEYNIAAFKAGFTFTPPSSSIFDLDSYRNLIFIGTATGPTPTPTPSPTPTATFQFSAASFAANEDAGKFQLIVTRTGDTSQAVSVDYATTDGSASDRGDYTTAIGHLRFQPGDTAKSVDLFITDDVFVEGNETVQITLSNPSAGSQLGGMPTTLLTILDNDLAPAAANPIDSPTFFVRQHYVDFLNREPDVAGLNFWADQITSCGADAACIERRRINVSAAFFLSIEFQETGYLVHRLYRVSFNRFPRYREFLRDAQEVGRGVVVGSGAWAAQLEASKQQFTSDFVARADFLAIYAGLTNEQYVDALNINTGNSLSTSERNALVAGLNGGTETRASTLRKVAEDADFTAREFTKAFVLAQYVGYLRRNPDDAPDSNFDGYNFWLNKLDSFGGDFQAAEMVKAFITSAEYRQRFGPP